MAAVAKITCNEMSNRVTSEAIQLHGGFGFTDEYPVSRLYRGARYGSLGGGASGTVDEGNIYVRLTPMNERKRSAEQMAQVDTLVEQRTEAKKNRDFATADRIRDELQSEGIILEDGAGGTTWRRS